MAEIKPQVYRDDRPAEFFEKFHRRARERQPGYMYSLVRSVVTPICLFLYRTRAVGSENVPRTGPVSSLAFTSGGSSGSWPSHSSSALRY